MNRLTPLLPIFSLLLLCLTSTACKTASYAGVQRDLYLPQTVWGPYTSMLHHQNPKLTPAAPVPAPSPSDDGKNVVQPQAN